MAIFVVIAAICIALFFIQRQFHEKAIYKKIKSIGGKVISFERHYTTSGSPFWFIGAIYVVSTDKEEQKTSLENQKEMFYSFIAEQGWDISRFYVDVESGTTDKRKEFQLLIADAKQRKFDVILTKELSRSQETASCLTRFVKLQRKTVFTSLH